MTARQSRNRVRGGRAWARMGRLAGPRLAAALKPVNPDEAVAASVVAGDPSPALTRGTTDTRRNER